MQNRVISEQKVVVYMGFARGSGIIALLRCVIPFPVLYIPACGESARRDIGGTDINNIDRMNGETRPRAQGWENHAHC